MNFKGIQLYSFQKDMLSNPIKTLELIASLGFECIESANSFKGNFYGLSPIEMKNCCNDFGMTLISGHVKVNKNWSQTLDDAASSGQQYLICSDMPIKIQTIDNYMRFAETLNKAGEDCKKMDMQFGYHNHGYEFESDKGQILYDILLQYTDPELVVMELDFGWLVVAGKTPSDYLINYGTRFPIWHIKDMNIGTMKSTEFGKGNLDISEILKYSLITGVKNVFLEQEEFEINSFESMKHNIAYIENCIK